MSSAEAATRLSDEDRRVLLVLARESIAHGVRTGQPLPVQVDAFRAPLQQTRGCFVTLHLDDKLRGCVGSLRARRPLVSEVARSAHMAAFLDPRFSPVGAEEVDGLRVHISVLSTPEHLAVGSEDELVAVLRPHVDGIILSEGDRLGTFLPDVWASIPDPREFVRHLKVKAGIPADYWSHAMSVQRYVTESFG